MGNFFQKVERKLKNEINRVGHTLGFLKKEEKNNHSFSVTENPLASLSHQGKFPPRDTSVLPSERQQLFTRLSNAEGAVRASLESQWEAGSNQIHGAYQGRIRFLASIRSAGEKTQGIRFNHWQRLGKNNKDFVKVVGADGKEIYIPRLPLSDHPDQRSKLDFPDDGSTSNSSRSADSNFSTPRSGGVSPSSPSVDVVRSQSIEDDNTPGLQSSPQKVSSAQDSQNPSGFSSMLFLSDQRMPVYFRMAREYFEKKMNYFNESVRRLDASRLPVWKIMPPSPPQSEVGKPSFSPSQDSPYRRFIRTELNRKIANKVTEKRRITAQKNQEAKEAARQHLERIRKERESQEFDARSPEQQRRAVWRDIKAAENRVKKVRERFRF